MAEGIQPESVLATDTKCIVLRYVPEEQAIACSQEDGVVEVTPKVARIRKRFLDPHERKRQSRKMEAA